MQTKRLKWGQIKPPKYSSVNKVKSSVSQNEPNVS